MTFKQAFSAKPLAPKQDFPSPDFEHGEKNVVEATNTQINTANQGGLSDEAGDGVKKARATTIVWSKNALILVYAL